MARQQHSESFSGVNMVMVVSSSSSSRIHLRSYSYFPTLFVLSYFFIGLHVDVTSEFTKYGTFLAVFETWFFVVCFFVLFCF